MHAKKVFLSLSGIEHVMNTHIWFYLRTRALPSKSILLTGNVFRALPTSDHEGSD